MTLARVRVWALLPQREIAISHRWARELARRRLWLPAVYIDRNLAFRALAGLQDAAAIRSARPGCSRAEELPHK